jgi:hypothetical protein
MAVNRAQLGLTLMGPSGMATMCWQRSQLSISARLCQIVAHWEKLRMSTDSVDWARIPLGEAIDHAKMTPVKLGGLPCSYLLGQGETPERSP